MKTPSLPPLLAALFTSTLLLAGCGGGGDGGPSAVRTQPEIQPTTALGPSSQYADVVAGCSLDVQKKFVRAYLDEVYFWYNEIVDVDPNAFTNIDDYFDALRVRTPDINGFPKDRFSAIITPPRRAALLQSVPARQVDFTTVLSSHTNLVPQTKAVTSAGGRTVGYIEFIDHDVGAQDDLIQSFQQLQAAGVQDLVLDLRRNSGGFLYIAQSTASMITGPGGPGIPAGNGKIFEKLNYNDKRPTETATSTLFFTDEVTFAEAQFPVRTKLPQLNLPRVFILASPRTCSASESIINSLRGIGVKVILVGTTEVNQVGVIGTCGKPYGFTERDNCGSALFPIEFKGTNAVGFGDYTGGFRYQCEVAPDTSVLPGSSTDPLLNAALTFVDTGACPAGTATGVQASAVPKLAQAQVVEPTRPSWAGRLLRPAPQR
jgi:hypothetical protein